MQRWGQVEGPLDFREVAVRVYRADLYRTAARELGIACPAIDYKPE